MNEKGDKEWLEKLGVGGSALWGGLGVFAGLAGLIGLGREPAGPRETEAMLMMRREIAEHAREALAHREQIQHFEILRAAQEDADKDLKEDIFAAFGDSGDMAPGEWRDHKSKALFSSLRSQRQLRKAMERHGEMEREHRMAAERLHAQFEQLRAVQEAAHAEERRQIAAVRKLGYHLDSCLECRKVEGGPYETATYFVTQTSEERANARAGRAGPTLCANHAAARSEPGIFVVAATVLLDSPLDVALGSIP